MKDMGVRKGMKVLDVCCGIGDWIIVLSKVVGLIGEVIGIDFSENMLEVGKEKIVLMENVKFVYGDVMELLFEDNFFDYVIIGFGLRNVLDYLVVLKEMNRVFKLGGMVVCFEMS